MSRYVGRASCSTLFKSARGRQHDQYNFGESYDLNICVQLGTFDPLPNYNNEKLVSLNIGRLKYWIGTRDANISLAVCELLGECHHDLEINKEHHDIQASPVCCQSIQKHFYELRSLTLRRSLKRRPLRRSRRRPKRKLKTSIEVVSSS